MVGFAFPGTGLNAEAALLWDVTGYCSTREPCAHKLAWKHQGVPHEPPSLPPILPSCINSLCKNHQRG